MNSSTISAGLLFIALGPAMAAAAPQSYKPETISRQSPREINVNLGPSLDCEDAKVEIGPLQLSSIDGRILPSGVYARWAQG